MGGRVPERIPNRYRVPQARRQRASKILVREVSGHKLQRLERRAEHSLPPHPAPADPIHWRRPTYPPKWEIKSGVVLDQGLTTSKRGWLAATLRELLQAADSFTRHRFLQEEPVL